MTFMYDIVVCVLNAISWYARICRFHFMINLPSEITSGVFALTFFTYQPTDSGQGVQTHTFNVLILCFGTTLIRGLHRDPPGSPEL